MEHSSQSKLAKIHYTVKPSSKILFQTVYGRRHGDKGALSEGRRPKTSSHQPRVNLYESTIVFFSLLHI